MKKLIFLCALALTACAVPATIGQSPAPLASTSIDDVTLTAAWKAFDVALDAIDLWKAAKPSVKGTPQAIAVANAIDKVTHFLTAAESAAAAGSTTDYGVALANAKSALTELRLALKGATS